MLVLVFLTLVDFFFVVIDDFRFFVPRGDNNVDDMLFGLLPLLWLVRARILTLRGVRDIDVEGGCSSSSDDVEASRRHDDDLLFSIIL